MNLEARSLYLEKLRHDGRGVVVPAQSVAIGDVLQYLGGLWEVRTVPVRSLSGESVVLGLSPVDDLWAYRSSCPRTVCLNVCDRVMRMELLPEKGHE